MAQIFALLWQHMQSKVQAHAQQRTPAPKDPLPLDSLGTFTGAAGGPDMFRGSSQVDGNVTLSIQTKYIGRVIEVVAETAKKQFPDLLDDCAVQVLPLNGDRVFVLVQLNVRFRGRPSDVKEAGRVMMLLVEALLQAGFALDDY